MRILLAIDGSSQSRAAAEAVAAQVWPPHSTVRVLIVVQKGLRPHRRAEGEELPEFEALVAQADERTLRLCVEVADMLRQSGLSLEIAIRDGDPSTELLEEARAWGAHLLVLGSHGRTLHSRRFYGSVAERVLLKAPCSVDVVPRHLPRVARTQTAEIRKSIIARRRVGVFC